jgi:hypothetical protein
LNTGTNEPATEGEEEVRNRMKKVSKRTGPGNGQQAKKTDRSEKRMEQRAQQAASTKSSRAVTKHNTQS